MRIHRRCSGSLIEPGQSTTAFIDVKYTCKAVSAPSQRCAVYVCHVAAYSTAFGVSCNRGKTHSKACDSAAAPRPTSPLLTNNFSRRLTPEAQRATQTPKGFFLSHDGRAACFADEFRVKSCNCLSARFFVLPSLRHYRNVSKRGTVLAH